MIFWSIVGIIIGLIIFLLLMNLARDNEYSKKVKHNKENDNEEKLGSRPRYCPVCKAKLGPKDVIYAEIFHSEPRDKVIIKGCKYCYTLTPEEAKRIRPYTKRIREDDIGIGKYL
ncbi:MAG: hypothetical protein ACP5PT_02985 [Brevinematia bacterium]